MSVLTDPRAVANLLLIEVGNSHVTLATSRDGRLAPVERIDGGDPSRLGDTLQQAWRGLPEQRLRAVVMASVVPRTSDQVRDWFSKEYDTDVLALGEDIAVPIEINVDSPASVGVDRLCSAAAAFDEIQAACAVASFGTATTIDCVDDEGRFRGGAILPGLALQARALHEGTARLPEVSISAPSTVYGGNTHEAIVNGIVYGTAGALREIVERYATDLNKWPRLVVTGGFGPLMRDTCDFVDALVPDLILRGMVLAYRRHYAEQVDE